MSVYTLPGVAFVETDDYLRTFRDEGTRRICVSGGREFEDEAFIWENLDRLYAEQEIYEIGFGCARGVDRFAWNWAKERGIRWKRYVADWGRLLRAAGTIRNGVMLKDFCPDLLVVFPGGAGTTNCARQARKMTIPREFIEYEDGNAF